MTNDDSFFREVNEELRSDRMKAAWRRFGPVIIAVAALIIVGVAGMLGYQYWQERAASQSGDRFLAALTLINEGETDAALSALRALQTDGHGAYPVLARMREAALLAEAGDAEAAIDAFRAIGADGSVPLGLREAARLRAAYLLVDHGSYEAVAAEAELLTGADHPMRHSAREALGLSAWKAGNVDQAASWFEAIANDPAAPAGLSDRAGMMLDLIAAGGGPA